MANVVSASMGGEKSGSRIRPCSLIQNNNFTQNPIDLSKPLNFSSIGDGLKFCTFFQKSFEQLTHLDLFNNDICNIEDYRTKVFKLLPSLKFLDDADADDNDEEESDDGVNGGEEGDEEDGEGN